MAIPALTLFRKDTEVCGESPRMLDERRGEAMSLMLEALLVSAVVGLLYIVLAPGRN